MGWHVCIKAVNNLYEIPALREDCERLMNIVPSHVMDRDSFEILDDDWKRILEAKRNLCSSIKSIIILCEETGMDIEERIGVDIKLPPCNDFSDFTSYVNDLEFIFSKCPFLESKEEKIKFENVDVGSTWLTFAIIGGAIVGGSVLLNNLAAFVDKCIVIRTHYLDAEKKKHDLEVEKENEDEKKIIFKYIDKLYKKQVDSAIEELEKISNHQIDNSKDGDERGRLEQCFEKMGNLIDKGLQIYSSIESPKEAKALFEPLEMHYLEVSNKMKLLEEKNKENEDENS